MKKYHIYYIHSQTYALSKKETWPPVYTLNLFIHFLVHPDQQRLPWHTDSVVIYLNVSRYGPLLSHLKCGYIHVRVECIFLFLNVFASHFCMQVVYNSLVQNGIVQLSYGIFKRIRLNMYALSSAYQSITSEHVIKGKGTQFTTCVYVIYHSHFHFDFNMFRSSTSNYIIMIWKLNIHQMSGFNSNRL